MAVVLIVDDEPNIIKSFSRLLRRFKFEILSASNGDDALKVITQKRVDLLITDQKMPVMTGLELIAIIRKLYPGLSRQLPMIIISGHLDLMAVPPEIFFLTKPFNDLEDLPKLVCACLKMKYEAP